MRLEIKGNGIARLSKLERKLNAVAKARLREGIVLDMAEETLGLISDEFRTETNPYGERWKPKLRPDGRKTLSGKTSRLKRFQRKSLSAAGFVITATVSYATYHQHGTRRMVRRMIVPTKARGLPRKWRQAFVEIGQEHVHRYFTG